MNVAWVRLCIGKSFRKSFPLGGATSVIQFDEVSTMVVLHLYIGRVEGSKEKPWIPPVLLPVRKPCFQPLLQQLGVLL